MAMLRATRLFSTSAERCKLPPFHWDDALQLKSALTPDEIAVADSAHEFSQQELAPLVLEGARTEVFPRSIMRKFGDMGLLGSQIPAEIGGGGLNNVCYGLAAREVERIDSGYRSAMSVQSSLVMLPIAEFGSQEQRDRFLPGLSSGELVGCFGLTEPDHGSDPGSMKTNARPHPTKSNVYLLNGSKTWITNSPIADVAIVWAKLDGVIRGFIVERGMAGFETPKIKHKTALRASTTGMILLDDVEVPAENLLPNAHGLKGPFTCLNSARYGIAWGTMGALEESVRLARMYALERHQFGKPLAAFQLVQKKLTQAVTDANYGLLAALHVGRLKDNHEAAPQMISMIKRQNCDRALAGARELMEIFGGNATADEYSIGRIAHNLQVVQTYEGQSDVHALILGRAITGVSAFA